MEDDDMVEEQKYWRYEVDPASLSRYKHKWGSQQERGVGPTNGKLGGRREGLNTENGKEPAQEGRNDSCPSENGEAADKTLSEEDL